MSNELLQETINLVFSGHLIYLVPFLFVMMVLLFADRLIELIFDSFDNRRNRRSY